METGSFLISALWFRSDFRLESGTKLPPSPEKRLHLENPEVDPFQAKMLLQSRVKELEIKIFKAG